MKLFDRHHGTQRFFAMFGVIILCFVAIYSINQHNINVAKRAYVNSTYLYQSNLFWSKTNDECLILGMGTNEENTKVAIMLQNAPEALETVNAGDYQVFLAGSNDNLRNHPECTLYSYGNGYLALVFEDVTAFKDMNYTVFVRNYIDTSALSAEDAAANISESSSLEYNEIKFNANFGMSSIPKMHCLDAYEDFSPERLYAEVAMVDDFADIMITLNDDLVALHNNKVDLVGYKDKISNINIPDIPFGIYNDDISTTAKVCNKIYDPSMSGDGSVGGGHSNAYGNNTPTDAASENATEATTSNGDAANVANSSFVTGENVYFAYFENILPGYAAVEWHSLYPSDPILSNATDMTYPEYIEFCDSYKDDVKTMLSITGTAEYSNDNLRNNGTGEYLQTSDASYQFVESYKRSLESYLNNKHTYFEDLNRLYEFEYNRDSILKNVTWTNNFVQVN